MLRLQFEFMKIRLGRGRYLQANGYWLTLQRGYDISLTWRPYVHDEGPGVTTPSCSLLGSGLTHDVSLIFALLTAESFYVIVVRP